MMKFRGLVILFVMVTFLLSASVLAIEPFGATVAPGAPERAPMDDAGPADAYAGNVTELTISGFTNTQSWQGYFGQVTGVITLSDAADHAIYNWSMADPRGEVYATTLATVAWADIACFDIETNGAALETAYNIDASDMDGVADTFALNTHQLFFTNNHEFALGVCNTTNLYDSTGASTFEEVLMTDGTDPTKPIFASILRDDALGFNTANQDFEMLVLEDGHGTDVASVSYDFYVELE